MRFGSIGTRAASQSRRAETRKGRADRRSGGFTLIEALVALALVLAFAAHVLLRTLLDAPFDRANMAQAAREGDVDGLRWRVVTVPLPAASTGTDRPAWPAYRVAASVAWGRAQMISAETVRLGQQR
jgi:prepilin-type N-terminal cleavage/methylation domain-containing protein